ncbi:MAG: FliI/YscN family ATPase [Pseudomonadota bacterium]
MIEFEHRTDRIRESLNQIRQRVQPIRRSVEGRLVRINGATLEARGCQAPIGSRCRVISVDGNEVMTEVVSFAEDRLYLMSLHPTDGVTPGSTVVPEGTRTEVHVGEALLGRVIDGAGLPLDKLGPLVLNDRISLTGEPINPLSRGLIEQPLDVGIRAINGILTIGQGQRLGLFAGSGVGKSTLLGAMTRNTEADVVVIGLIGERGREVRDFVEHSLSEESLRKSVLVATPADATPLMRIQGAQRATAIAEYFRDQGKRVLLLMDSLTRFAQAQRELALSVGEFPVQKGYPASVFAMLPQLIERAGNTQRGSMTALYSVLVEGDDLNDPISDASRAILDGHIVLSRTLAESGIYPAIDIEASVSRSMNDIVTPEHRSLARDFRRMFAIYQQNRDLITVGAYQPGSDLEIDRAIALIDGLRNYVAQPMDEAIDFESSISELGHLMMTPENGLGSAVAPPLVADGELM